jgi:hypothetical protein
MAIKTDYSSICPIFDQIGKSAQGSAGIILPFALHGSWDQNDLSVATSAPTQRLKLPFSVDVITVEAYAAADANALKSATASTEPVIEIGYGASPVTDTSAAANTAINTITCTGTGDTSKLWAPGTSTTRTAVDPSDELYAYVKTASASTTSTKEHGAAKVVVWCALKNGIA